MRKRKTRAPVKPRSESWSFFSAGVPCHARDFPATEASGARTSVYYDDFLRGLKLRHALRRVSSNRQAQRLDAGCAQGLCVAGGGRRGYATLPVRVCGVVAATTGVSHLRRSGICCDESQAFRPALTCAAPTALGPSAAGECRADRLLQARGKGARSECEGGASAAEAARGLLVLRRGRSELQGFSGSVNGCPVR